MDRSGSGTLVGSNIGALSDSSMTAYDVIAVSIRQATVDDTRLGRVAASFHVLAMAAMLSPISGASVRAPSP